jgi:hypothetical protein
MIRYKGYKITVSTGQEDNGKWRGSYKLLVIGKTDAHSLPSQYLDRTFDSADDAMVAAENAARAWIDKNPL